MKKSNHIALAAKALTARSILFVGLASAPFAFGASCASSDPAALPEAVGTGGASGGQSGAASGGSGAPVAGSNNAGAPAGGANAAGSSAAGGGAAGALSVGGATAAGAAGASGSASAGSSGAAGTSGGSLGCAGKAYKLCEDFESGSGGAIPTGWTKFKGYGAGSAQDVALATDQFHGGKMALKSSSMATGQGRVQRSLAALGPTAYKHWGRVFYKVQSPATKPSSGVLHVTFVGLYGGSQENRVVDIVEDSNGKHQWLYNNPDDNGSLGSSYDWAFDADWHCAEWQVDVGAKSYKFFSDSKEVTAIGFAGKADSQMTNYTSIIVGSTFYQTPPTPFVMWFDDLAIDDTQIGCK